jgi:hypothetical protein
MQKLHIGQDSPNADLPKGMREEMEKTTREAAAKVSFKVMSVTKHGDKATVQVGLQEKGKESQEPEVIETVGTIEEKGSWKIDPEAPPQTEYRGKMKEAIDRAKQSLATGDQSLATP